MRESENLLDTVEQCLLDAAELRRLIAAIRPPDDDEAPLEESLRRERTRRRGYLQSQLWSAAQTLTGAMHAHGIDSSALGALDESPNTDAMRALLPTICKSLSTLRHSLVNEPKADAEEKRDAKGFVIEPLDEAAYMPMKEILDSLPPEWKLSPKKLTKMLNDRTHLIRQTLKGRRHGVHRGDWDWVYKLLQSANAQGTLHDRDFELPNSTDELDRRKAAVYAESIAATRDEPGK